MRIISKSKQVIIPAKSNPSFNDAKDETLWLKYHDALNQLNSMKRLNKNLKEENQHLSKMVKTQERSLQKTDEKSQTAGQTLGNILEELRISQEQAKKYQLLYHQTEKSLRSIHLHYSASQHQLRQLGKMLEDESNRDVAVLSKRVVQLEGELYEKNNKTTEEIDAIIVPSDETSQVQVKTEKKIVKVGVKQPTMKKPIPKPRKDKKIVVPQKSIAETDKKPEIVEKKHDSILKSRKGATRDYESDFSNDNEDDLKQEKPSIDPPAVRVQAQVMVQDNVLKPNLSSKEAQNENQDMAVKTNTTEKPSEPKIEIAKKVNLFKPSFLSSSSTPSAKQDVGAEYVPSVQADKQKRSDKGRKVQQANSDVEELAI